MVLLTQCIQGYNFCFRPIMISVQKLTGVMYSLVDGRRDEKNLLDFQKRQDIKQVFLKFQIPVEL